MITQLKKIFKLGTYQPLNLIEISKDNLLLNYKYLSSINRNVKIAPVLKSNAYGHGIVEVAKILDSLYTSDVSSKPPFFCVDSIYEAYELLKMNKFSPSEIKIKTPILIMGYIHPENLKVKKLPFLYAISTLDIAEAISRYQPEAGVHIFVDTGMHREGVPLNELPEFLKSLPKNLKIEGLMSHLASGNKPNNPLTKLQVKNFKKALDVLKSCSINPKYRHLANSDGLISSLPKFSTNVARVGIALFGIGPSDNLKPVLSFKTKIIQVKKLQKGDKVGYEGTYTATKSMVIGILPAGYYDGVDRRLSNTGFVLIDEVKCPIIGLVSMNIITINVTPYLKRHPELACTERSERVSGSLIGKEVFVYSNKRADKNSIENTAKICKTIPYDLLVHLASSTKRMIV